MALVRWKNRLRRWWRGASLLCWYHRDYRLPMTTLESHAKVEPRRADFSAWYLAGIHALDREDFRTPQRIRYADLALVHTPEYLESLSRPESLARVFGVSEWDVQVDELLHTIRLACGGTLEAARTSLKQQQNTLNLLGGFHHASPGLGAGLCPVNDIAVAIAKVRQEGFSGQINILDLDAHPPDGTSDCLLGAEQIWQGSLSGSDWGDLEGVDETVLPERADDETYLTALDGLLGRMPRAALAFVIAGGDVLAGDHMGLVGMTLAGVRERDRRVLEALDGTPSVWLPGGGYHKDAWKVLAGTGRLLATGSMKAIPKDCNPLRGYFSTIARKLDPQELEGEPFLTEEDLPELLGLPSARHRYFMNYYTVEGLEYGLYRYGLLKHVRRLGYKDIRIECDATGNGERMRLYADAGGQTHLLAELVLQRKVLEKETFLYVHWMTLRDPRGSFDSHRPQLPGQETPGLGLADEAFELLIQMAHRLHFDGVAYRPSWYHVAYAARRRYRFVDPVHQGHFEAMLRDFAHTPLQEVSLAFEEKRVLCNAQPYPWNAELSATWLKEPPDDATQIAQARDDAHFSIQPSHHEGIEQKGGCASIA